MRRYVVLGAVVLLAVAWRVLGFNWDNYGAYHPDEVFLRGITAAVGDNDQLTAQARARCAGDPDRNDFFNTRCSSFNPNNVDAGNFAYGTLPVFWVNGAARLVADFTDDASWRSATQIQLVGRAVNVFADTLSVVVIYLIGKRIMEHRQGIMAAMLYAGAVLPIQQAHFWTVDTIAHFFFVTTLYFAVVISQNARAWWPYLGFGVALGCAVASRANLLTAAALAPVAVALEMSQPLSSAAHQTLWRYGRSVMIKLVMAGLVAFFTFRVAQPYAFAGPDFWGFVKTDQDFPYLHLNLNTEWRGDLLAVASRAATQDDNWPPSQQWVGRPDYLYPWLNWVWGMGATLAFAGTLGVWVAIVQQIRKRQLLPEVGLFSVWFILYFGWQGQLHFMTLRYYLPLYSVVGLLAVWWVERLRWRRPLRLVLVAGTFIWAMAFTAVYRTTPTRVQAAVWLHEHVPAMVEGLTLDGAWVPLTVDDNDPLFLHTVFDPTHDPEVQLSPVRWQVNAPLLLNRIWFQWLEDVGQLSASIKLYALEPETSEQRRLVHEFIATGTGQLLTLEFGAEEAIRLDAGGYEWEASFTWSGAAPFVHIIPVVEYAEVGSGGLHRLSLPIESFYNRVPYLHLDLTDTMLLRAEQRITITELAFAHQIGPRGDLTLQLDGQYQVARFVGAISADSLLGETRYYRLDTPLTLGGGRRVVTSALESTLVTGTTIATDGAWDTSAPQRMCWTEKPFIGYIPLDACAFYSGYDLQWYIELPLQMTKPDQPRKLLYLQDVLQKADYYVIASNRMYDALPRNQAIYEYTRVFYDALFGGQLGYRQLARFEVFPRIGPLVIPDQVLPDMGLPRWVNEFEAEEAFTVYDHPTLYIFKRDGFDAEAMPLWIESE